jgi:hypothetical protein
VIVDQNQPGDNNLKRRTRVLEQEEEELNTGNKKEEVGTVNRHSANSSLAAIQGSQPSKQHVEVLRTPNNTMATALSSNPGTEHLPKELHEMKIRDDRVDSGSHVNKVWKFQLAFSHIFYFYQREHAISSSLEQGKTA